MWDGGASKRVRVGIHLPVSHFRVNDLSFSAYTNKSDSGLSWTGTTKF
jgi:hypothetical protein